ncbi:MAG: hypothetical protein ACYTG6_07920 [Planctomycetota bacterium]|jgi:class 3 adenylate cyclase
MEITLSDDIHDLIADDFRFEDRGDHEVKGIGTKRIYSLLAEGTSAPEGYRPGPMGRVT